MNLELRMAKGPQGKQKKVTVLGFRPPPPLEKWILDKTSDAVSKSDALLWAVELAHDYYEASKAYDARLKAFARANDLTELGALKRVIEAGLDALERKK